MAGYEISYHGDGFEVNIKADTSAKLSVLRGAVRDSLVGFKIFGVSDKERMVSIGECPEINSAAGEKCTQC